uniref:Membrane associated guanylate kinase, WW and PDZ domain containing 2 n=1 Tax=Macrostomum lignano TaxID=282301 RepID=A0A1I8I3N5_9PLAT
VKSLVPGGPAAEDGRLQSGDVLVYVNEQLVLGGTHEDLISLFRQIEPGQLVTLTVSTGYRLPRPRAEVITKVAAALDTNGARSQRSSHSGSSGLGSPGQAGAALAGMSGMSLGRAELIKAVINRSVAGFGFTIADSPQGQRVRQIVDESRCRGLQPGDLLIEVNSRRVKELPHTDVVRILAECPIGQDCSFLLQRGSLPQASAAGPPTFRTSASHSGGLASLADSATAAVGFGHSSFLPPSAGSGPSSSSGGAAISNFSRHAPLRSSRPDTGSSSVTVTAYPPPAYPPPASSAASSGSTAGTVPRFRSRTPGPETSLSGSAFDDQQQQQQQPARPRTPTGLVEGRGYHQQQQVQQLHPQPPSASAATAGYGSLGRRPRAAAAAAAPQFTVTLLRNQLGLGIRILGGAEEGSQVRLGSHHRPAGPGLSCEGLTAAKPSGRQSYASSNPAASGRSIQFRGIRQDPGMFTANPSRLAGELLTVRLVKSPGGLGITIVGGGDRAKPEFLQVKSLVPGGPAAEDGRLQSGDVLVYVNEQLVLGGTHEDLISLFRQIEPGQLVTLTVSTGYRLPVSASDPRAEVITKVAAALDTNGARSQRSSHSGSSGLGSPGQAGAALAGMSGMSLGRAELIKAVINRSVAGFGFTIADSPQGQRVRQIVDESRCRGLQPGDLLIEVNSRRVKELPPHRRGSNSRRDCSFLLQRGSLPQASAAGPPTFRTSASHSGGLASLADSATAAVGFGHSSFLPPSAGSGPSSSSGGAAISNFSRHAPLRSSRPDTGSSSVTVTAYPPPAYPPPASSAASSGSTAGTVPRFRSRTPGPETSLSGSAFDDQQQQQQQPARPRTPTGLVEGRGYHQQQQVQQLHPQPPSASAATAGYGSLGRRPRAAAAAAAPQFTVTLLRNQLGLGIRILGGAEEGSQVTIGQLVPGSAAHADGRIRPGDEIVSVNGTPCVAASHHRVVQLLESAGPRVSLGLRRNPVLIGDAAAPVYPYDVTLTRRQDEGFGIVIVSSVTRPPAGSGGGVVLGEFIGHIIDGSPASRCDKLRRGDRILAVNGVGAAGVHHEDIVRMVRDSGLQVRLTVGPPLPGQAGAPPPGLIGRAVAGPASQSSGSPEPASVPAVPPGGLFTAVLHKTDKGFGFSIRGGAEFNQMPFYVLRIAEGGGAHQSGRLRVGDEIVSINDRPLAGITHTEAIQVIRSAGSTLKLVCRRPVSAGPAD